MKNLRAPAVSSGTGELELGLTGVDCRDLSPFSGRLTFAVE